MQRRSLGSILPRLVRQPWRMVHAVQAIGDGYVCLHRDCPFASRDLGAAVGHAVRNQYVVLEEEMHQEER